MDWEWTALSDRGLRRARNEDSYLVRPDKRLYAVADGMGGHAAGDVASRMAVEALDREFPADADPDAIERLLVDATKTANCEILEVGRREADKRGMGTTLTTLVTPVNGAGCIIAHIGDSRAYRIRSGSLEQLTTDHTWVQQQVDLGALTLKTARSHPLSSVLTRVLGVDEGVPPDVLRSDVVAGDMFLLCSDGLTGMVDDASIAAMLVEGGALEDMARALVAAANERGGYDNSTVVLVRAG
jgi:protein phosphatase